MSEVFNIGQDSPEERLSDKDCQQSIPDASANELREPEKIPNPESFPMLALESEQVRVLSEELSKKCHESLLAIFNASAGTIYGFGIDSIGTQFNRQMFLRADEDKLSDPKSYVIEQRQQFANEIKRRNTELKERIANEQLKILPSRVRKLALIETANKWINEGRLSHMVVPELDFRSSSYDNITDYGVQVINSYRPVLQEISTLTIDWSDSGRDYPESVTRSHVLEAGPSSWYTSQGRELETPGELVEEFFQKVQIPEKGANLVFCPMHSPEKKWSDPEYPNWQKKIWWIRDWPVGLSHQRALRVKEQEHHTHDDIATFFDESILKYFSQDETMNRDEKISKLESVQWDAIQTIREMQIDSDGNNYFQREKKYRVGRSNE